MKSIKKCPKELILFLLFSIFIYKSYASACNDSVSKRKTISKLFTVSSTDKLEVDNIFGDITIKTWDSNEMKIDINISSEASSEEKAQHILDKITVMDSRETNVIKFKTNVGDIDTDDTEDTSLRVKLHKEQSTEDDPHFNVKNMQAFHINYIIYMPSVNSLFIKNRFGNIGLPNFKGPITIINKFGLIQAGNLENLKVLDFQFGEGSIGDIHNGEISLKFNGYVTIGILSGSVHVINEFSKNMQYEISNNIKELTIEESHSSIQMVIQKQLSANIKVQLKFGDFLNDTKITFIPKHDSHDHRNPSSYTKNYHGSSGAGQAKINIKSKFGDVKISQSL